MSESKVPNILLEKISLDRVGDFHEAVIESSQAWFAESMIPKPDLSIEELEAGAKELLNLWENDEFYWFLIVDGFTNQIVGFTFFNHVNRLYQMANMGYAVRTGREGQGIATAAARRLAQYGFEKLSFHRIEIVVKKDNPVSLKVAEKLGAVREGLLRNRLLSHGAPVDAYMHSLIPSDFAIHKPT
jgi:RimJ/RimL family protein N-acetyltransferase